MARNPKPRPFFFKVLIGDFTDKLRIPPAFVKNFKGNVPIKVILKSNAGAGRLWPVKVQHKRGGYYFCGGWPNFVRDHGLEVGDFPIFIMVGSSTFDVRIGGRTCCEKKITLAAKRRRGRPASTRPVEIPTKGDASTSGSKKGVSRCETFRRARNVSPDVEIVREFFAEYPSFEIVLKKYQYNAVVIPKPFARVAGLTEKRETEIWDPRGRRRKVGILLTQNQVRLSKGWSSFRKGNELVVGDTLLFQFIAKKDSIHIQINRARDGRGRIRNRRANAC